ncbi:calcium-binding protein [Streptomyces sp. MBT65]|uniref:calcium-binding protein n=1 Tax=Streptomyces sp. MBT65 TaxID=1488395 RepID=UPI00190C4563|nr:calcium-binding protein [Streptomyces sp. MBT65]MBK3577521.1 calcium-binding protein [Streptomyces sp. MBT65]
MLARPVGHRVFRVGVVPALLLAAGIAVGIAVSGPTSSPGPPAVAVSGHELVYAAAPGQANDVTVTETLDTDRITYRYTIDDVVPIEAGTGCRHPRVKDRTRVSCAVRITDMATDPLVTLSLRLGDGDDTAVIHNRTRGNPLGYNEIYLGSGDDTWTGTGREALNVHGGDGEDTLTLRASAEGDVYGDNGDDTLTVGAGGSGFGGKGDDTIRASGSARYTDGGPGDDTVHGPGPDPVRRG